MSQTVLITGGAGFIGSHYIRFLLNTYHDVKVMNADALTYSGNLYHLRDIEKDHRYQFLHVDLAEKEQVKKIFSRRIDQVVHFAAESHVDRSIQNAEPFIRTNIAGTHLLIEAAKRTGIGKFVHISTDEVYGSIVTGQADEQTALAPGNPYSASKAASDLLCLSFYNTYQFPVVIIRCTNNYGPCQYPEKLIPHLIRRLMDGQPVPIYGDGKQERDWLHVRDHCHAIDLVRIHGRPGEIYNISAGQPMANIHVAKQILDLMGKPTSLIEYISDRPGHDVRYALDSSKIRAELGWAPAIPFEQGLEQTVEWYLQHPDWWASIEQSRAERG
ncbi:dTDP-glucose 4,6-dehydratase [Paenactinomyces guangxiensis]|uniref:dTDP-glucose 4,6-dehydratase n=1 Tax=Paenactinomyces guangxiensis TaxID=1490290 RepID=A0A7W1WQY6_9BACL|nr:dTDP-glucose 4,6-dehydratase [Paenactinomyces guangxiensis]MBA4494468.1 dTDP-glucose 4,6-dehydratase [Paenactinomyces guangxiensis]MBH8591477.1 dTDP-glucose 4,6-dehydratase [Paenactinomyces guangxiensis]